MGRAQGVGASGARFAWIILTLAGSGCTFTHRYTVPQPVVEPPPSLRIEGTVGVRYEPGLDGREHVATRTDGLHQFRSVIPVGPSVRALCDDLLPRLFARTRPLAGPEPAQGLDAVLDVRLVSFDLRWPSGLGTSPCRAQVVLAWDLATPSGEPIARWTTEAVGEQPPPVLGTCIGDSVALALQDAGRAFVGQLLSDAAVRAWLERAGIAALPVAERPPAPPRSPPPVPGEASRAAQDPWAASGNEAGTPSRPRPVSKASPQKPGTSAFRVGAGWFSPRGTSGALEDPSGGVAFLVGATYHPLRPLGIDVDVTYALGEFASTTAPPAGTFETKSTRMQLSSLGFSAGVRGIAPLGHVEPWAGAGFVLLVSRLTLTGSTLGFPGEVEESGAAAGPYAAAGVDVAVGGKWLFGGQCRWTLAEQDFGRLSAGRPGNVGGPMCLAGLSLSWP